MTIKLKARTSYRTVGDQLIHIAGFAKCEPVEGQVVFWSIGGSWFAEDGRFVESYLLKDGTGVRKLCSSGHVYSIAKEENDPRWWEGVVTDRK